MLPYPSCFSLYASLVVYVLSAFWLLWLFPANRHLFRGAPDRDERVGRCDRQALPLTEALLDRGWQHGLTAEQHVFALMPLRHTPRYVYTAAHLVGAVIGAPRGGCDRARNLAFYRDGMSAGPLGPPWLGQYRRIHTPFPGV